MKRLQNRSVRRLLRLSAKSPKAVGALEVLADDRVSAASLHKGVVLSKHAHEYSGRGDCARELDWIVQYGLQLQQRGGVDE